MFKINNTSNGVKAFLGGFNAKDINSKVQECKDGNCSCECDPTMMQKIQSIDVQSEVNGASITIVGNVSAEELEPMMKGCLL
jgi:hypothetical protein